jgi:hypothetical protein
MGRCSQIFYWCKDCNRKYVVNEEGEAVEPEYYLSTDEEGLIELTSRHKKAFELLFQKRPPFWMRSSSCVSRFIICTVTKT